MPTQKQLKELVDNCKWKYMKYKGVDGFLVTGANGNSIFLPAGGQYIDNKYERERNYTYLWSSDCDINRDRRSSYLMNASFYLASLNATTLGYPSYYGQNIRPIKDKNN